MDGAHGSRCPAPPRQFVGEVEVISNEILDYILVGKHPPATITASASGNTGSAKKAALITLVAPKMAILELIHSI